MAGTPETDLAIKFQDDNLPVTATILDKVMETKDSKEKAKDMDKVKDV